MVGVEGGVKEKEQEEYKEGPRRRSRKSRRRVQGKK